jgi:hypothetical protein
LSERRAWEDVLVVDSAGLREGDDEIIAAALSAVLDGKTAKARARAKEKT